MSDHPGFRATASIVYRDVVMAQLGYKTPPCDTAEDLIALAKKLDASELETTCDWRTEPPFPGKDEIPEKMPVDWRMICASNVYEGDTPPGVIFATLMSGRTTTVYVNIAGSLIPKEYTALD